MPAGSIVAARSMLGRPIVQAVLHLTGPTLHPSLSPCCTFPNPPQAIVSPLATVVDPVRPGSLF